MTDRFEAKIEEESEEDLDKNDIKDDNDINKKPSNKKLLTKN